MQLARATNRSASRLTSSFFGSFLSLKFAEQGYRFKTSLVPEGRNVYRNSSLKNLFAPAERHIRLRYRTLRSYGAQDVIFDNECYKHLAALRPEPNKRRLGALRSQPKKSDWPLCGHSQTRAIGRSAARAKQERLAALRPEPNKRRWAALRPEPNKRRWAALRSQPNKSDWALCSQSQQDDWALCGQSQQGDWALCGQSNREANGRSAARDSQRGDSPSPL